MSALQNDSWRLGTPELIQQIAMLAWLNKAENGEEFFKLVSTARVWYELYQRASHNDEIDAYKAETVLAIANYVKSHPRASRDELTKEIEKQIQAFAAKIEAL
ncbi:uncharacterized protein LOC110975186 [Acanthaster planci]|uniref:Uncharacterized protein LOC110975186 n=1 Tax=Acanthaster planci TaxID=133434 RepID=A0A8B7XSY3_ACAPL|nr:uncharacterized protein LOC110975186 [Acanthaster planci]